MRELLDNRRDRNSMTGACQPTKTFQIVVALAALCLAVAQPVQAQNRLARIRERGTLVCGIAPGVAGFATVDSRGQYSGLDVDLCRAVAAAIFGTPAKVRFVRLDSIDQFRNSPEMDIASRRLTWSLQREGAGRRCPTRANS
jgi:general L-amino acid transport system substrate-binding protein